MSSVPKLPKGERLILASGNEGKLKELRQLLAGSGIELGSLRDYPNVRMPPEDGETFADNARIKARGLGERIGEWVLSDDSGLVVEALAGAPGVHSARFAGPDADDQANNLKLLEVMAGIPDERRAAAFVCVLVLRAPDGSEQLFSGRCPGRIAQALSGSGGFGYDPLFLVPPDFRRSMAELDSEEKNRISHRGAALKKLCAGLQLRKL